MSKLIRVGLYDSEKYAAGVTPVNVTYINAANMTKEEVDKKIAELKEAQKKKNHEYSGKPSRMIINKPNKLSVEFDNETGNTFCLFGASKSGKTTMMIKLYNEYFPVYHPLKSLLTTLYAMNGHANIYKQFDKYVMHCPLINSNTAEYIDWQRRTNSMNANKFYFLNMFDDFINVRFNDIINNLLLTYRNSNMSAIICLQYVNLLSKAARSNINNIFLMHMNTDESIEVACKAFLSGLIKKLEKNGPQIDGIGWYRDMTTNHNYIYIHPISGKVYLSKTGETFQL